MGELSGEMNALQCTTLDSEAYGLMDSTGNESFAAMNTLQCITLDNEAYGLVNPTDNERFAAMKPVYE